MHKRTYHYLFQIGCYYVAWFATIFLAASHHPLLAPTVIWLFTVAQYAWQHRIDKNTHGLLPLILILCVFGFFIDTIFIHCQWMIFNSNPLRLYASPLWMIGLWASFAITYFATCQSLFKRPAWLILLSVIGFPLAYKAGGALGAAEISNHIALVIIAAYGTALMLAATALLNRTKK